MTDTLTTALGICDVTAAQPDDLDRVLALRDQATQWLLAKGIDQWQPDDPGRAHLETAARDGHLWVLRHQQRLIGSVTVAWHDPLIWPDATEPAGYIHTLLVDRQLSGHRLGRALLGWAEHHIADNGRPIARLDCVRANRRLRRYYETTGYQLAGFKDFPHHAWAHETARYQKPLTH